MPHLMLCVLVLLSVPSHAVHVEGTLVFCLTVLGRTTLLLLAFAVNACPFSRPRRHARH